jgi:arylsulfatase A-like enzyme
MGNRLLASCMIFLLCMCFLKELSGQAAKKNLLFIVTDQQRYDALAYAGKTTIKTPNLDRLAQQGAFFRNAYSPCAVCGPARASMLTGHTVESTGVYSNDQTYAYSDSEVMTMPTFDEVLAEHGYRCEYYGKWHALSARAEVYENPVQHTASGHSVFGAGGQSRIYRDYLSGLGSIPEPGEGEFIDGISKYPYFANPLDRYYGMSYQELQESNLQHAQPDQHGELLLDKEHTMTAFQARQAIEAIERLKDTTFSITCSFHFPHSPMLAPPPYYGLYPVEDMLPPESIGDDMQNSPYANFNGRNHRTEYADPDRIRYMISEYYGLITEIDDWVGQILDKLDELDLAENTLVIFTSDHGEMLGAHGMREKNVFYEESAHIPLLISSAGQVPAETTVEAYVSLIDLYPTILDYLGIPEHPSEGKSLRGLIEGTDTLHGSYVVTEWDRENSPNYMVVKDGWKLIIPYTIKSPVINAMYDLNSDPHEMNNLLGNHPDRTLYLEKAEELRACLLEWLAEKKSVHHYSVSQRDLLNGGRPTGNDATFISQEVPELVPGDTVAVSITMKNSGTSTWTREGQFKLGSQAPADNTFWGPERLELAAGESVLPGEEATFTFEVFVPDTEGIFHFQWQMVQEGEEWFGAKSDLKQLLSGNPGSYMDDCDQLSQWNSSSGLKLNQTEHTQGTACIEFSAASTDEFKKVFSPPFNCRGTVADTELRFWYYVSDVTQFESSNQVEIGSSGRPDRDEFSWQLSGLTDGWNYLTLKTSEASKMGSPDLHAIDWFRIYHRKKGTITTRLDAVQLIDPNIGPLYTLLVEGGSGDGNYPWRENVSISAHPPPDGMIFDRWLIQSGSPVIEDSYAPSTMLTMGKDPAVVSATYKSSVSSVAELPDEQFIELYPNPASSEFYIAFTLQAESQIRISLMDLSGRIIRKSIKNFLLDAGPALVNVPVQGMMPGAYLLTLCINNRTYARLLNIDGT